MRFSYQKMWKVLKERNMTRQDLMDSSGICKATLYKLNRGDIVTSDVILRVCIALSCEVNDIMEIENIN